MFLVEIDQRLNRLHVVFIGSVDKKQGASLFKQLQERAFELQPGFEIISDLSDVREVSLAAKHYIRKMMDLCNELGVSRIIRIISHPTKNFGFRIMSNFHYDKAVRIVECQSREEAARKIVKGTKQKIAD